MWQSSREFLSHFLLGNIVSTIALVAALLVVRALTLNAMTALYYTVNHKFDEIYSLFEMVEPFSDLFW